MHLYHVKTYKSPSPPLDQHEVGHFDDDDDIIIIIISVPSADQ